MVRPVLKRSKEPIRRRSDALGKKLLKKAINTKRAPRRPIIGTTKLMPVSQNNNSRGSGAVRKTRTATEAASGAQRGWRKLYVGDLAKTTEEPEIREEFGKFGEINTIWIARNPPGFAFIDYMESRDAARALRVLDGSNRLGPNIKVEFAKKLGPRNPSVMAAMRERHEFSGRAPQRPRMRRLSDSRGGPRRMPGLPPVPLSSFGPPWRGRSPPPLGRMLSPPPRHRRGSPPRRFSPRRSPPSPLRRGSYPPLPPLPSMFDPFDPRFREMALMGGWSRGRSPLMGPPPPPPPSRYRSRSPSPRFRGRSPPRRRSPGRNNRGSHKRRHRDMSERYAAASLVYPPLSLPPPSFVDLGDLPPLRLTPPPRGRSPARRRHSPPLRPSPPPLPQNSRYAPPPPSRGRSPSMRRSPSPPRGKHRSPPPYRLSSMGRSRNSPPRNYSPPPPPPDRNNRSLRNSRSSRSPPPRAYAPPPSPPRGGYGNNNWSPPSAMRRSRSRSPGRPSRRSPLPRSRSRSSVRGMHSPRPRSPPDHRRRRSRSWSSPAPPPPPPPASLREIPKAYSSPRDRSPMSQRSKDRRNSSRMPQRSPSWGHSPPRPRSPDHRRQRSLTPRNRSPPFRNRSPPIRNRSPPHRNGSRTRSRSPPIRNRSPPPRQYHSPSRGRSSPPSRGRSPPPPRGGRSPPPLPRGRSPPPPRHRNSLAHSQRSPRSPVQGRRPPMNYPIPGRR